MKWMIASDLHGSYFYASQMQQAFEREQADRLLLLGDLLYHGPRNDLPEGYAPKQVMPLLNGMKDRLLCVRGNCDAEVDQMVLEFPVLADYAVLPVGRRLVYATHGHVYNTKTPPPLAPGDILLHGHYHSLRVSQSGDSRWVIGTPSADNGSAWFTNKTGETSVAGILAFDVQAGQVPWSNLRLL